MAQLLWGYTRGPLYRILYAILLIAVFSVIPLGGQGGIARALAGPCPGDPPPPPPQQCGDQPCPSLPNTGEGYGACEIDPESCGGQNVIPQVPERATTAGGGGTSIRAITLSGAVEVFSIVALAAHPCPGDPPSSGNEPVPAPPPPPPIPVCAACEAPGVAADVELPAVTVRMNPDTGLVNVPTWFWAEGYRGQDLVAARSWSAPYEPTTIEVRYSVKRYIWNFGDGGQIESKSLGQPYPAASEIANAYGWSSRTEPGGVFHPGLAIEWDVEYRVNGGAPQSLPSITRAYPAIYPVQELQPIITNP